jgi:threonine synthase
MWHIVNSTPGQEITIPETSTLAEGVCVRYPLRYEEVIKSVIQSSGTFMAVSEDQIASGRNALAFNGFYVEHTSAIVWTALIDMLGTLPDPVVVILTGSGLKSG